MNVKRETAIDVLPFLFSTKNFEFRIHLFDNFCIKNQKWTCLNSVGVPSKNIIYRLQEVIYKTS